MKKLRILVFIIFTALIALGSSSCLVSRHQNQGRHLGWFKNNNHHNRKVYVIQQSKHNQPKINRQKVVSGNKQYKKDNKNNNR
ncbi:MAG: hypothetical protein Q7U47_10215 [Paludibacter sp.]|nr:hypothetical protein [Paludibacter sp.]